MNVNEIGSQCCGCGVCVSVCPKKCIDFLENSEGFFLPKIDSNLCVNCGICLNKCPVQNFRDTNCLPLDTYIGFNNDDEIRYYSSSGGIFDAVSKYVLENNGVVFGAAFDKDYTVIHTYIKSYSQINKLRGSKYMQSLIGNSYIKCKEFLDDNKLVLFSGVACQISGLKSFLNREYTNLYTLDVLCHGTPSSKVWKKYLNDNGFNQINNVSFRNKSTGWENYSISIDTEDKEFKQLSKENDYMRIFLSDLCLRESCYSCKFKSMNRASDITLGDAWGINQHSPEMNDDKGVSVIVIHSEKGIELLDHIKKDIKLKRINLDKAIDPNADSRKPVRKNKNRTKFFDLVDKKNIHQLVYLCDDRSFFRKIIVCFKRIIFKILSIRK